MCKDRCKLGGDIFLSALRSTKLHHLEPCSSKLRKKQVFVKVKHRSTSLFPDVCSFLVSLVSKIKRLDWWTTTDCSFAELVLGSANKTLVFSPTDRRDRCPHPTCQPEWCLVGSYLFVHCEPLRFVERFPATSGAGAAPYTAAGAVAVYEPSGGHGWRVGAQCLASLQNRIESRVDSDGTQFTNTSDSETHIAKDNAITLVATSYNFHTWMSHVSAGILAKGISD